MPDTKINVRNPVTPEGLPNGGSASGTGIQIDWQEGPRRQENGETAPRNGASMEDVLRVLIQRLEFLQSTPMRCDENDAAINGLRAALDPLESRQKAREAAGVDGSWTPQVLPSTDEEIRAQAQPDVEPAPEIIDDTPQVDDAVVDEEPVSSDDATVPVGDEGHIPGDHDDVDLVHDTDVVDGELVTDLDADLAAEGNVHGAPDNPETGGDPTTTEPEVTGPSVPQE